MGVCTRIDSDLSIITWSVVPWDSLDFWLVMSRHTSPIPECATSNCDASLNARVRIISPPGTQPNLEAKRRLSPAEIGSRCNYCKNFRLRQACFDVAKCGLGFNEASKTRPAEEKCAGARACKFHGRHVVNVNEIAKAGYVAALTASYATTFGDLSENWSLQSLSDSGRRKGVSSDIPTGDVQYMSGVRIVHSCYHRRSNGRCGAHARWPAGLNRPPLPRPCHLAFAWCPLHISLFSLWC